MKAMKVMSLLKIGRTTLRRWREEGKLKATQLDTGHFEWDDESVYKILNGGSERGIYLYARSCDNADDIEQQFSVLRKFAEKQGYKVADELSDVSNGLTMDGMGLRKLFRLVKDYKVSSVIVTYKDRISRSNFDFLRYAFALFGTDIIVLMNLPDRERDKSDYPIELEGFNRLFQEIDFPESSNYPENEESEDEDEDEDDVSTENDEGTGLSG